MEGARRPGEAVVQKPAGAACPKRPEIEALMAVVGRMPQENLEEIARSLLRCAAGYERTGDAGYLTNLAIDSLVTLRLQSDPDCEKALSEAPAHPAGPTASVDVREMIAQRGL